MPTAPAIEQPPLCLTLELARARESWDPHAFEAGEQSYLLREAGGVYQGFDLVWDEQLARDLGELARPSPDEQVIWRLGERLRRILLVAGWERADAAIGEALRAGRRVMVDFISGAAELYALPWELVPLRSTRQRLAERPEVLLRYAWPATTSRPQGPYEPGGRLLFAWSDAADPVPWREQEALLKESVAAASPLVPTALEVLPRASAAGLAEALSRRPTLLHLLCHGLPGPTGGLALQGPGGEVEVLDPAELAALIAPVADSLRLVVLCACGSGAWSSLDSKLGSIAQAVHRAGVTSVVAFRIPVSIDGANRVSRALYQGLLREHRSLEDSLLVAQQALMGLPTLDWAALQLLARPEDGLDTRPVVFRPYRGLLPFRREHRPFFFGRERVVAEVVQEMDALVQTPEVPDLLFLAGPSGVGKSSLLAAGVLPALEERWPGLVVRTMRPGNEPVKTLQSAVEGLGEGPSLLVIDQLEELFTHGASKAEIRAFAEVLWPLLLGRMRCIVAIRGDYMDRLSEVPLPGGRRLDALAYDDDHRVFIPRPLPEELGRAITGPAAVVGLELDPGLCERILEDVGQEPGALPLVQHAMDLLWQRREGRRLTLRAYEQDIGGLDGALSRHADSVLQTLQEHDRPLVRRLLTELVSWTGQASTSTRRRLPTETLLDQLGEGGDRAVAALVDASLLVRDEGDARHPSTLEIAHEALIRRWPTLAGWLEAGAEARAARDWLRGLMTEREREPTFVLRGAQLAAATEMRERLPGELPEEILAFIQISERVAREEAEREEHRVTAERARIALEARRARRTLIVSAVVLIGVVGLLAYAVKQKRDADEKERAANIAEHKAIHSTEQARLAELRTAAAAEAEAKARQDQANAEQATRKANEDAAIAAAREAEAKAAMRTAEVQRQRAMAAAEEAEARLAEADRRVLEARALIEDGERFGRDLRRLIAVERLIDDDPTRAAVVLREVEEPFRHPRWADFAGRLLSVPIQRWAWETEADRVTFEPGGAFVWTMNELSLSLVRWGLEPVVRELVHHDLSTWTLTGDLTMTASSLQETVGGVLIEHQGALGLTGQDGEIWRSPVSCVGPVTLNGRRDLAACACGDYGDSICTLEVETRVSRRIEPQIRSSWSVTRAWPSDDGEALWIQVMPGIGADLALIRCTSEGQNCREMTRVKEVMEGLGQAASAELSELLEDLRAWPGEVEAGAALGDGWVLAFGEHLMLGRARGLASKRIALTSESAATGGARIDDWDLEVVDLDWAGRRAAVMIHDGRVKLLHREGLRLWDSTLMPGAHGLRFGMDLSLHVAGAIDPQTGRYVGLLDASEGLDAPQRVSVWAPTASAWRVRGDGFFEGARPQMLGGDTLLADGRVYPLSWTDDRLVLEPGHVHTFDRELLDLVSVSLDGRWVWMKDALVRRRRSFIYSTTGLERIDLGYSPEQHGGIRGFVVEDGVVFALHWVSEDLMRSVPGARRPELIVATEQIDPQRIEMPAPGWIAVRGGMITMVLPLSHPEKKTEIYNVVPESKLAICEGGAQAVTTLALFDLVVADLSTGNTRGLYPGDVDAWTLGEDGRAIWFVADKRLWRTSCDQATAPVATEHVVVPDAKQLVVVETPHGVSVPIVEDWGGQVWALSTEHGPLPLTDRHSELEQITSIAQGDALVLSGAPGHRFFDTWTLADPLAWLWDATTYCLSAEERQVWLSESEADAARGQEACREEVVRRWSTREERR